MNWIPRCATRLGAGFLLIGTVQADILRVGPGQPYADIPPAIAAASDGDVIFVFPGTYSDLDVVNKSISVIGRGTVTKRVSSTTGCTISSLAAGKSVLLANLAFELPPNHTITPPALHISGCQGVVRVDNCSFFGADLPFAFQGGTAVVVSSSTDVVLTESLFVGGDGRDGTTTNGNYGGNALSIYAGSRAALYDCKVYGGEGGDHGDCGPCIGGDGGHGVSVPGEAYVFASCCEMVGGLEGNTGDYFSGERGRGLIEQRRNTVQVLDCQISWIDGTVQSLPGRSHSLRATTPGIHRTTHRFSITGQPGDEVYLLESPSPLFSPHVAELNGVLAVDAAFAQARPIGTLVGTTMGFYHPLPTLEPGVPHGQWFIQALVRQTNGELTLSGPINLVLYR